MAGILTINSDLDPAGTLIKRSIAESLRANKLIKETNRTAQLDFYEGRGNKPEYLENYGFKNRPVQIPKPFLNLTKNIINRSSLVYKQAPDRKIMTGKKQNDAYTEFLAENKKLITGYKYAERYKNLLYNVLYRPMWYNDRWNPWIETDFVPHFLENDALNPVGYSIYINRDLTQTETGKIEDREMWMYWSDEFYYWHDSEGNITFDPQYPKGLNPFKRLPFIELRKEDAVNEYWPDGATDLISANQAINVTWCDLIYSQHNQAFNQPWGSGISVEQAGNIRIGADKFIGLSEPEMSLGLLDYNPKIDALISSVKSQIELISSAYNLTTKWAQDGNPASGFSLLVQNRDMIEMREDDVERAEMQEDEIYDIIQIQDEVLNLGNKLPERDKKNKLMIDFHEISFPINQAEEIDRLEFEYKHNISTPIDTIQSKEGLTQEEAIIRHAENKKLNTELSPREKAVDDEIKRLNEPEESNTE